MKQSFKHIIFSKYGTNLKIRITQSSKNFRYAPI